MDDYNKHLYALILAGGGGTRLWPRSRNENPKQFIKLFNGKTLTQITSDRLNKILPWEKIFCVTVSEAYKKEIVKEVPEFLPKNIIVEPARKDTGPAHAIGASYIYKKDPDAVIITEAADRLVNPVKRYLRILTSAAKMAYENKIFICVGVEPRYPHPGLGHIKKGKKMKSDGNVNFFKAEKFVEKPPLPIAKRYTASGNYYWNAGQFVWRADSFLDAVKNFEPEIFKKFQIIMDALGTKDEEKVVLREYGNLPKTTSDGKSLAVDYLVAEKSKNMWVVHGDFFWTDIGDWKEVWENLPKDEMGNVVIDGDEAGGQLYNIDTTNALIQTDGRLIAVVDVDNIVIVDTKDALLICSKSKAQNVKKIVERLKIEGKKELL
jgi:mannose-1-phosphate guanylyltransferase